MILMTKVTVEEPVILLIFVFYLHSIGPSKQMVELVGI